MNSPKRQLIERKSKRLKVFEPAVIVQGPRESRAHLLNVSRAGASIHCERVTHIGETVTITCGAVRLTGQIVWTGEHRSGLEFNEPIGEAVMATLLRSIDASAKG